MRAPFANPSENCPLISFDMEVLAVLPLCDPVPEFSDPEQIARLPELNPPDVAPPDSCLCLDVSVTAMTIKPDSTSGGTFKKKKVNGIEDCCDGVYDLELDIPCLPLDITGEGTVGYTVGEEVPSVVVAFTKNPGEGDICTYHMDLTIKIPEVGVPGDLGLEINIETGGISVVSGGSATLRDLTRLEVGPPAQVDPVLTLVHENDTSAALADAIRVINSTGSEYRLCLDANRVYIGFPDQEGGAIFRPLSDFFGVVAGSWSSEVALRLDYVEGDNLAETGSVVSKVPLRAFGTKLYPKGAFPLGSEES